MLVIRPSCMASALSSAILVASLVACTKDSGGSGTETTSPQPSATTASSSPTPSASASAAADVPPEAKDGGGDAGATAAASASASAAATAHGKDGGAATTNAAEECGKKPLPDCPLQAWMKANVNPAVSANDAPALAKSLEKAATFAPPGYTNWASISKDGAKAAQAGDMNAAKASCRTCHDQYKKKYQAEMRARKI